MTNPNGRPDFATMLAPLEELRASLIARRDELKTELDDVRERVGEIDRVLKAAGVIDREPRKPRGKSPQAESSPAAQTRVLEYVETQDEVTARGVSEALGMSSSYASKVLVDLRERERIRLLRVEGAHPSGKGRRPVYGPWPKGGRS